MPSLPHRNDTANATLPYGAVFQPLKSPIALATGQTWVNESLQILKSRMKANLTLRALPLTEGHRKTLTKRSIDFLQVNQQTAFEEDNLKHVGRIISNIKIHAKDLESFLGMSAEDVQLLAALHDLGKAKVPSEMAEYLESIYGKENFLGIRVLPHELFSFYWIERLGTEVGISAEVRQILMDLVANHNLGPDLNDPQNRFLLAKDPQGHYRHWWVEHWDGWSTTARKAGLDVDTRYGHTISPLANTLVLFDRIDGGHPHSWEKFLNQDLVSGRLKFSPSKIVEVMVHANATAREQLVAVGRQLHETFVPEKAKVGIEEFAPLKEANRMLDRNDKIVSRLKDCNSPENFAKFKVAADANILYCDQEKNWYRFDGGSKPASAYQWNGKDWKLFKNSDNPIALLLQSIYHDWQ